MKHILFVAVAVLLVFQLSCGGSSSSSGGATAITWETDLKQALDKAGKENKPVMIFFTSSG